MNSLNTTYPLISVIVPVYNTAPYLERCFNCLRKQSYSNLEVVLVDDGSSDESGKMCDQIATEDSRFKVFHIANRGASLARKLGLEHATGEFVSFVDSDDYIASDYIEQLYSLIEKYHVNISACRVQRVYSGDSTPMTDARNSTLLEFEQLMPRYFKYEFWGFPAKVYRKSIFDRISFPTATLSEDYLVMAQLFLQERQMAYTDSPLYYYEYHEGSLSHLKLSERAFEEFENVKAVYELMQTQAPQYSTMALSNVVETCIKLLSMIRRNNNHKFTANATPLRQFLRTHLWEILSTKAIYWKLKVVCITLLPKCIKL